MRGWNIHLGASHRRPRPARSPASGIGRTCTPSKRMPSSRELLRRRLRSRPSSSPARPWTPSIGATGPLSWRFAIPPMRTCPPGLARLRVHSRERNVYGRSFQRKNVRRLPSPSRVANSLVPKSVSVPPACETSWSTPAGLQLGEQGVDIRDLYPAARRAGEKRLGARADRVAVQVPRDRQSSSVAPGRRPHSRWFRGLRRTRSGRGNTLPLHARRRPAARGSSGGGHRCGLMLSAVVGCGRPSHPAGLSMSLMYGAPRQIPGGAGSGPDRFALPEAARELRDDSGTEGIRHLQDVVMDRVVVADVGAIVAAELM